MILLFYAQGLFFNGGLYGGLSRTTQKVSDFKPSNFNLDPTNNRVTAKGNFDNIQNQKTLAIFLGGGYSTRNLELQLAGFLSSNLGSEEFFKNRLSFGPEISVLYFMHTKLALGILGGIDFSRFKIPKYKAEDKSETIFLTCDNPQANTVNRFFIGAGGFFRINSYFRIGLKYHALFSNKKHIEEKDFSQSAAIEGSTLFSELLTKQEFSTNTSYLTHRFILGIEFKTRGEMQ